MSVLVVHGRNGLPKLLQVMRSVWCSVETKDSVSLSLASRGFGGKAGFADSSLFSSLSRTTEEPCPEKLADQSYYRKQTSGIKPLDTAKSWRPTTTSSSSLCLPLNEGRQGYVHGATFNQVQHMHGSAVVSGRGKCGGDDGQNRVSGKCWNGRGDVGFGTAQESKESGRGRWQQRNRNRLRMDSIPAFAMRQQKRYQGVEAFGGRDARSVERLHDSLSEGAYDIGDAQMRPPSMDRPLSRDPRVRRLRATRNSITEPGLPFLQDSLSDGVYEMPASLRAASLNPKNRVQVRIV